MSTMRSSPGVAVTLPDVPTDDDGGRLPPSVPSKLRKSTPVTQLRTSMTRSAPMPRPPTRMPMPVCPRMSSMLLRSPGVHFMARSSQTPRLDFDFYSSFGRHAIGKPASRDSLLHADAPPFPLMESGHRQHAARQVTQQNCRPHRLRLE